jgi:hypothetical protein
MIKLWRHLILPVLQAAQAKTLLEIGAEYGTSTKVLHNYVKANGGMLLCIDPVPAFDADAFERNNPDALQYFRDLSLHVLPSLPQFDAAMVDGDHNWYTVFNELKQIEALHGHDPMAQPIVFLHDLAWPYGRRDLYYDPSTIPAQYRQPHEQKGILPNRSELVADRGMNEILWNACHEGGARNGVLTGVEDYLAQSQLDFDFLNLPIYYGFGILVTRQRLAANRQLQQVLDGFRMDSHAQSMLALAEHLRCVDGIIIQAIDKRMRHAESRVAQLELELQNLQAGQVR